MPSRGIRNEGDVVAAIYDAALDDSLWGAALDTVRDHLGSNSTIFYCEDTEARRASFFLQNGGFSDRTVHEYSSYYIFQEPGFQYRKHRPLGTVSVNNMLVPDAEHERSELYRDCFRPAGFFYSGGVLIAREGGRYSVFGMQRTKAQGPFRPREVQRLARLAPHLGRALQIGRLFARERQAQLAYEALLERLPQAVLLLDGAGRIVFRNSAARHLTAGPALHLTRAGLRAAREEDDLPLQALLRDAIATGQGRAGGAGGALCLTAPAGAPPCRLLVLPLPTARGPAQLAASGARCAVVVQPPHPAAAPDAEILAALFDLTPAEAALTQALVAGRGPREIAADTGRSIHTVRSQVKSLFSKVGVHRQADLVSTVLASPAVFWQRQQDE